MGVHIDTGGVEGERLITGQDGIITLFMRLQAVTAAVCTEAIINSEPLHTAVMQR